MALTAVSNLVPNPASAARPLRNKTFTFVVDVFDQDSAKPTMRTLELSLAASNDLFFTGGTKSVTQKEKVGAATVTVTFSTKITGTGAETAFFRVTLKEEAGDDLMACLVRLE